MATINYTAPDGSQHQIPLPAGADAAQTVAQFESTQGFTAAQPLADAVSGLPTLDAPGDVPGSIEEANALRGQQPVIPERTTFEKAVRGVGLGARTVVGAIPKLATGVADLGATIANVIPAAISAGDVALGGKPLDARLPTGATASLDEMLDRIFPTPETFGERVVATGGEIALTGGLAGAALAPKVAKIPGAILQGAPEVAQAAKIPGAISQRAPGLAEEIGLQFAKRPGTFSTPEATGGVGAATGGELAAEADASPGQRLAATVGGGLAGIVAPQSALNISRRGATALAEGLDTLTKGEIRAARTLQEATADPEAAARAALDRPEGVSRARATEEPGLQAIEARVLKEDTGAAAKVATELEAAETRTLTELADQFGPTSNKADFQQAAIERGAAPGATIRPGQPDEMLDDAAKSFNAAYKEAEGFPVTTETVAVEGGNVPLTETLAAATSDTRIIADAKWRKGVKEFLDGLLGDVGRRVGPDGTIDSADLIEMRQVIRQQQRQKAKSGQTSARASAESEMLQNANAAVTEALESQLPEAASQALRATDARYVDFVTVQNAVFRSGEKGLTPEALRAAVKARAPSPGQVARGQTGELGALAERSRDVSKVLGKPDEASRLVRGMDAEQLQVAKADFNKAVADKATSPTTGTLDGKKFLAQIEKNRETLKAAGFTDNEIGNMERVGKALRMVQGRSPTAVDKLLEDNVGTVMNLMAAIAGSKGGTRLLKLFGSGGTGPSLILAQFGAKTMRNMFKNLSVDKADAILREAMFPTSPQNKDLMAALLTKPTASLKKQADAVRTIKAFLAEPAKQVGEETEAE